MKKLLPILFVLIITSCSKEIPLDQLVERNGVSYQVNQENPFTGLTLSYHPNGQLESRVKYKNGLKDGLTETFNQNGQILESINFKENIENGPFELFHENGQLQIEGIYNNGLPSDGQLERFYENGSLESRINFKDGQQDGPFEIFYKTGQIKIKGNVISEVLFGLYESYHENGNKSEVKYFKNNKLDGPYKSYWTNGNLKKESDYEDDKESVEIKTYYESGELQEHNYLEGVKEVHKKYYKNGPLLSIQYKVNGVNEGPSVTYYENGIVKYWTNYKGGEKIGNNGTFFSNGEPNLIYGGLDGDQHGWTYFGSEDGSNPIKFCYEYDDMKLDRTVCDGLSIDQFIEKFKVLVSNNQ